MTPIAKRAPRILSVVALVACASCGGGPPVWAPTPVLAQETSAGCLRARELRKRAPQLLDEGRVDRAVRVLQRAEDLCAVEAPATWGGRVTALAILGRSAESLQLATRIERSDRASDADRAAAAQARKMAEEHARAIAAMASRRDDPELFDPAEKKREAAADLFRRGRHAAGSGDHAAAKKLFLEAWSTWHPNPRALIEAGLAAQALGERAEAQRLWDRAAYDDSASGIRPEVPEGAPRLVGGAIVAWSRSGARLAVAGDEEIVIFDADLGPILHIRTGEAVTALGFASGDATLVAGLHGGHVRIYDTVTGSARGALKGHRGAPRAIAISPDGGTLATASDEAAVRLWDAATGKPLRAIPSPRPAIAMAFRANGADFAWADDAGAITIADIAKGTSTKLGRVRGAARAIAIEGDALFVVTATERFRFDLDKPRAPSRSLARGRADAASFGGGAVAIETASEVIAIDLATGDPIAAANARDHGGLAAFAIAPDARAVAAVFRDRSLALLPAKARRDRRDVAPLSPLAAFAAAPTGKAFAGAAEDGRVIVWSVDPARLSSFAAPSTRALAFSPDGRSLAVGADRKVDLRDLASDRTSLSLDVRGRVDSLAFSTDGMRFVVGHDGGDPGATIFTAGSTQPAHDLRLEGAPVRAVRFSPDGRTLLLAAKEGVVLWRPEARKSSRLVPFGAEPRDVVFTPDGAGMIIADKRGSLVFGKPIENAPAPSQMLAVPSQALAIAVAGNGILATAEGDRAIGLRSAAGVPIARFRAPEAAVRQIAILPQGIVAASFADGAIRLFRASGQVAGAGAAATLRPVPGLHAGALAGLVEASSGHLEILGPDAAAARAELRCRIGPALYPFDVCAEQFTMMGLLPMILSGQDPAEADP